MNSERRICPECGARVDEHGNLAVPDDSWEKGGTIKHGEGEPGKVRLGYIRLTGDLLKERDGETGLEPGPVWINVDKIDSIRPGMDETRRVVRHPLPTNVAESLEEILALIEECKRGQQ